VTLAEAQAAFHALVTGPPAARARAGEVLRGTPELPAEARAGVYADMWLWRQVEALRADFPALSALAGDEGSFRLFEAYLRAHPSEDPDIGRLGRALAAFLAARPALLPRPDLADLAALEWARQEAFFAAPGEPLGREALAAIPPDAFPSLRLGFVASLRLLRLGHDVAGPFAAAVEGEEPPAPAAGEAAVVVWRRGHEVFHAPVEPDEAAALAAALGGAPLGEALGAFAARPDPAAAALGALLSWLDEGFVAAAS
jgi:hypothetical protein